MTPQKYLATTDGGIDLSVLNAANKPEIYTEQPPVTLKVKLTNLIGSAIPLISGSNPCKLTIFFPDFFTKDDLSRIKIEYNNWTFTNKSAQKKLELVYSGTSTGNWAYGEDLAFDMTNVSTAVSPDAGSMQINFDNFGVGVPDQQTTPFSVTKKPKDGNGDLTKVLQVSLDNQGQVFVSPTNDAINNTLFLNIKNVSGDNLYTGKEMWKGTPMITVVFVYGRSSGSLAPDDPAKKTAQGSAWNIEAKIPYAIEGYPWETENPKNKPALEHPKWILKPTNLNQGILGKDGKSNITFAFDQVISFTPPGHTQMVITFSGFMKDEKTPYDSAVYVLDIVKQNAPPTRGLVNFFSPSAIINVAEPNTPIPVPLRWAMFEVPRLDIICSYEGMPVFRKSYTNRPIVDYDNTTINIPGVTQSSAIIFTAQAYNNNAAYLNSIQFTVFVQASIFYDPRDGKTYPVVRINNRLWMAENLDYVTPDSLVNGAEDEYGRLYTFKDAQPMNVHGGWRIPNKDDWEDLVKSKSYDDLIEGGRSGFNATLNGIRDNEGHESSFGMLGDYWSSAHNAGGGAYCSFSFGSKSAFYVGPPDNLPASYYLSVRYVKDIS